MPTVNVLADDVLVHSVQTDHRSIYIRGDGPNERGFLSVKSPVQEPPQVKVPPGETPPDEERPVEEPPPVEDPPVKEPPTDEPPHHRRHDTLDRARTHRSGLAHFAVDAAPPPQRISFLDEINNRGGGEEDDGDNKSDDY